MTPEQVTFPLRPVYEKTGIAFVQGKAVSVHPEGDGDAGRPYVKVELTEPGKAGQEERVPYDWLINATGPKLNFDATPGLGPQKNSLSVCTFDHAAHASKAFDETVARMKAGEKQTLLIGTGHGNCTCQGAAFEYIFNVEFELRRRGVRDKARVVWISNEHELGDFGMGGMFIRRGGYVTHSRVFTESLYTERGIEWITRAGVKEVAPGEASYETLDGDERSLKFDFAMLLPPFSGVGLKAFDRAGADITPSVFAPSGFMLVDGDYAKKPYEEWSPDDWPRTYQSPKYPNVFAVGIAFAPPHAISKPMTSPKGTPIFPTPPRTGMPTGVMAREVAFNIVDMIKGNATAPTREGVARPHGGGLHRVGGRGPLPRNGRLDDALPDRPRLQEVPRHRARPRLDLRRDRPRRALDQAPPPLRIHLQGQGEPPLGDGAGMSETKPPADARTPFGQTYYPPVPTEFTKKMRTNLLWQLFRFAVINVKILRMVRKH